MKIDSVCTYCGVGCDIVADIKDNKIVKMDAGEGVVSQGNLCIKGYYGYDFATSKNRLTQVKIRESFIEKNRSLFSCILEKKLSIYRVKNGFYYPTLEIAYEIVATKYRDIIKRYGSNSTCSIGGARTNCESSYLFQKFTRQVLGSPHIDNCARVCHAPSLRGMRSVIGEGAATNPFDDINEAEFLIIIGSNTTEAHPIVANRVVKAIKKGINLALFEVRDTTLSKFAKYSAITPYETNLLVLNMLSFVIISEKLYNREFITQRAKNWQEYKNSILNDPYADPDFFQKIEGYEYLSKMIREIAREYATKKSMILWGLGVTEHNFGSFSVMAISNLAVMTGNIGKVGAGLYLFVDKIMSKELVIWVAYHTIYQTITIPKQRGLKLLI